MVIISCLLVGATLGAGFRLLQPPAPLDLAVAALCVGAAGIWFTAGIPEGAVLITLDPEHGLTSTDALAAPAIVLAGWLVVRLILARVRRGRRVNAY